MTGRITRSASKAAASDMPPPASPSKRSAAAPPSTPPRKRSKANGATTTQEGASSSRSTLKAAASGSGTTPKNEPASPYVPPTPRTQERIETAAHEAEEKGEEEGAVLLHPALTFDFADAKKHLIAADPRWRSVMDSLVCKPFEDEKELAKPFNPFRHLVSSILGQQISWLAARSIQHKFCRLFFPSLPEKLPPPDSSTPRLETPFPTPHQVLSLPDRTTALRGAGLSGRKVEYIVELAERFEDGRLSAKQLWGASDDELYKTLIECRGIGPWSVHMAEIFCLKRPDVLPVGDLGIQKNLCRWFTQDNAPSIHPRKLVPATPTKLASSSSAQVPPSPSPSRASGFDGKQATEYAVAADVTGDGEGEGKGVGKLADLGAAEVEKEEVIDLGESAEGEGEVKEEDREESETSTFTFPETSNNLTPGVLKARLNGKKLKGNIYLTPQEMEELTAAWKPYRSVACWYLWSISDGTGDT
ncbi:hypothetical protein JCM10213_007040 [Rhodosporidiobolus nylandii]